MTKIVVVAGEMGEMVQGHGGDNQRIIHEQVVTLAQLAGEYELAPSDWQDPDAQVWNLSEKIASGCQRREVLGVTAEQVQRGLRGGQLESLDRFSQRQAMKHFAQDHRGGDEANLASLGAMKQERAAGASLQGMVDQHIGIQEDRFAGGEPFKHSEVPEIVLVRGRQFQSDLTRNPDDTLRGLDRVGGAAPRQDDSGVVGQRQFLAQFQQAVSVGRLHRANGHQGSPCLRPLSTITGAMSPVKGDGKDLGTCSLAATMHG